VEGREIRDLVGLRLEVLPQKVCEHDGEAVVAGAGSKHDLGHGLASYHANVAGGAARNGLHPFSHHEAVFLRARLLLARPAAAPEVDLVDKPFRF
jgi:hypothetical protein